MIKATIVRTCRSALACIPAEVSKRGILDIGIVGFADLEVAHELDGRPGIAGGETYNPDFKPFAHTPTGCSIHRHRKCSIKILRLVTRTFRDPDRLCCLLSTSHGNRKLSVTHRRRRKFVCDGPSAGIVYDRVAGKASANIRPPRSNRYSSPPYPPASHRTLFPLEEAVATPLTVRLLSPGHSVTQIVFIACVASPPVMAIESIPSLTDGAALRFV